MPPPDAAPGSELARPPQLAFVNLLRGVAAIAVAIYHVALHPVLGYPARPLVPGSLTHAVLHGWFDPGKFGVAMFFVISGFLIPNTLRGPSASLLRFAVRRGFRLYPVYWLSIAVLLVATRYSAELFPTLGPVTARRLLANATMLQGFFGQADLIGVFWTLQIELVFYGVCAALFVLGALGRREEAVGLWLGGALAVSALRMATGRALPVALFLGISLMFLGDILRQLHEGRTGPGPMRRSALLWLLGVVPTCAMSYQDWPGYVTAYWAGALTVIAASAAWRRFEATRVRAVSELLGDLSYSVYLFHPLIAMPLTTVLLREGLGAPAAATLALLVTLGAAWVIHRAVERPCIELGHALTARSRAIGSPAKEGAALPRG